MFLGRVIGTCVATQKSEGLTGVRLLVLEPIDASGKRSGDPFVAADPVSAGPGEVVYWVGAREAALALEESFVPVDAAIVGLVDEIDVVSGKGRPFLRGRDDRRGENSGR
ncbi:MAG: EutN/CcmL family microcompartment protein [Deltaproteobacteria bacterium]